ncbi:hypothetical protein N2152v2_002375 [Parachlorella kessleri]
MTELLVTPGERLALAAEYEAGSGTFVKDTFICASLVGIKHVVPPASAADLKPRLEIVGSSGSAVVPNVGDVVTARVNKINPRLASLDILCVGEKPVQQRYSGIIRVRDVRATEIDKVVLSQCFRPGDIVRASVLSLGDARSYYLTTAENELGAPMVPISWQEMQCPKTKAVEKRKVAKVSL